MSPFNLLICAKNRHGTEKAIIINVMDNGSHCCCGAGCGCPLLKQINTPLYLGRRYKSNKLLFSQYLIRTTKSSLSSVDKSSNNTFLQCPAPGLYSLALSFHTLFCRNLDNSSQYNHDSILIRSSEHELTTSLKLLAKCLHVNNGK